MDVDAQRRLDLLLDLTDGGADITGQSAAVGIAEHQAGGSSIGSGSQTAHRIFRVGFIAVKEVLGVKENGESFGAKITHGISNHSQVLFAPKDSPFSLT